MLKLVTGVTTKILLKKTEHVKDPLTKEIQALLPEMVETMHREKGIGLAAPQIGQSLRLAIAEADGKVVFLINPDITSFSQEKIVFGEGCLSLPGEFFPITRSAEVTVRYQDERGLPKKMRAKGLLAIIIQHEVDHLDGILIVNRYKKQQKRVNSSKPL
ncbi:MAG: peptide deformylase [Candidatus Moranbacteria bacterium RIFCSPLOWO2_12_FULL_48_12]|nr:MAG: peptide deformylase [Candidatus Moranbacteria bacterium RIFCSPLOWO2_12_FULL_48_12]